MKRGDWVEVLTWWAQGCDPEWLGGKRYYDEGTAGVVVQQSGGALDGALSLHAPEHVREAWRSELLLGVDMLAVGVAYREHCRRGHFDYRGWP